MVRLGPGTGDSGLSAGDRVCMICIEDYKTRQRARWWCIVRIPACLSRAETMRLHTPKGGFAQIMLTLAQHLGAGAVFVTCEMP